MAKIYSDIQLLMEILRDTLKLPGRNKDIFRRILILDICFLVMLVPGTNLIFSLFTDSAHDLANLDPKNPQYFQQAFKDLMIIMGIALVVFIHLSFFYINVVPAMIYASAMSFLRKEKDMTVESVFLKATKETRRRFLVTWFYCSIPNSACAIFILLMSLLVLVARARAASSYAMVVVFGVLIFLAIVFNTYLVLVTIFSLVISVLESDCYGLDAIAKARQLVNGKKAVGLVLAFVLMVHYFGAIYIFLALNQIGLVVLITSMTTSMIGTIVLIILVKMTSIMACTVLYFECKKSHGERVMIDALLQV